METITVFNELFKEMDRKVEGQLAAQEALCDILSQAERKLFRHEEAVRLRNMKSRILEEVAQVEYEESAAQRGSTESQIILVSAALAVGGLITWASGSKRAFSVGAKLAKSVLDKGIPFGSVLIGVRKGGIPNHVKIIPLSRLARDSNVTEADMRSMIQDQGYTLLNPQAFVDIMGDLEGKVLEGSLCVPVPMARLQSGLCQS